MSRPLIDAAKALWRARLTSAYLAVLLVTTIVRHTVARPTAVQLLHASSTDVVNLEHDPLRAMTAAALWVAGAGWLPWALVIAVTLAPLERRLGVVRMVAVFVSGHVIGTLLTELPLAVGVALGWLPASDRVRMDYGVSYGVATAIVVVAGMARPRLRHLLLGITAATLLADIVIDFDMTTAGHIIAVAVGFAWWPLVRRWGLWARFDRRSLWLDASRPMVGTGSTASDPEGGQSAVGISAGLHRADHRPALRRGADGHVVGGAQRREVVRGVDH